MAVNKNIKYINKSFGEFRANLIDYAKTYFPTTYNDFSESSPGNMFIEMSSYVGDVMSFYLDTQVQENFLIYAKERENLLNVNLEKYINTKGRKIIGWDEILEGGLAPNATVMSWRGISGGVEAAKQMHDVIMSPVDNCYLNLLMGLKNLVM